MKSVSLNFKLYTFNSTLVLPHVLFKLDDILFDSF